MSDQQRIDTAINEARTGSSLIALIDLEGLVRKNPTPPVLAWLGYCLAKEKSDFSRALVLCSSAVDTAPDDADLYLAQGRIYQLSGRRYQALTALRKGLKMGRHELIVKELNSMGLRKEPVFGALDRTNMLNVMVGRVMTRFNFR
jgi:Flp pilus assembly protein TadD